MIRGLYILNPIFEGQKRLFIEVFFKKFWSNRLQEWVNPIPIITACPEA
jgi:hypothetical protein